MSRMETKLAIIAGNGDLPEILVKSAKQQGFTPIGIAITKEAENKLQGKCDKLYSFSPGQLKKMIDLAKDQMIQQIVFIGKVPKLDFLKNIYKLDWMAIKYLSSLSNFNDDSIHAGVVKFLGEHNIEVLPQAQFLKHLFLEKEIISKRKPTLEERVDIEYGFEIAKKVASLDIGQTVVVKNKMILAVEAIEGTDEAIKRGCALANGNVVVIKVSKPVQDERFDIPTIGGSTIESLAKNGGGIIAFEANKTIVVNKDEIKELADKYNICLLAI